MIDHCISAFNRSQEEKLFRIFLTDVIGGFLGVNVRYADLIDPAPPETRTAAEIKESILAKFRD